MASGYVEPEKELDSSVDVVEEENEIQQKDQELFMVIETSDKEEQENKNETSELKNGNYMVIDSIPDEPDAGENEEAGEEKSDDHTSKSESSNASDTEESDNETAGQESEEIRKTSSEDSAAEAVQADTNETNEHVSKVEEALEKDNENPDTKAIESEDKVDSKSEAPEKLKRELKSLQRSAQDSKIITEYTSITDKSRKSRRVTPYGHTETSQDGVVRRNSNSSEKSGRASSVDLSKGGNTPKQERADSASLSEKKRSMRSQNAELPAKQQNLLVKIQAESLSDKEGTESSDKKDESVVKKTTRINPGSKDQYCWQCHKDGINASCKTCPRSYHIKCLRLNDTKKSHENTITPGNWVCPECLAILHAENIDNRSYAMRRISLGRICELLKFALQRMIGYASVEPFRNPVDIAVFPDYYNYVVYPMDLSCLEKNIRNNLYGSTEAFLADARWIHHNCHVFNSGQSKLTTASKAIIKICRQEMNEIECCPDCYKNANTRNDSWFVEACTKPHMLVWAKLKGFPYWPAKAMSISTQNMVDVRFFGAHDKAWVPVKECFLYSRKDPNTTSRGKRQSIVECIKELDVYIKNLEGKFGKFHYAPYRTPFDPNNLPEQLSMMLPGYKPSIRYSESKLLLSSTPKDNINLKRKTNSKILAVSPIVRGKTRTPSMNNSVQSDGKSETCDGDYETDEDDEAADPSRSEIFADRTSSYDTDENTDMGVAGKGSPLRGAVKMRGGYTNSTGKVRVLPGKGNLDNNSMSTDVTLENGEQIDCQSIRNNMANDQGLDGLSDAKVANSNTNSEPMVISEVEKPDSKEIENIVGVTTKRKLSGDSSCSSKTDSKKLRIENDDGANLNAKIIKNNEVDPVESFSNKKLVVISTGALIENKEIQIQSTPPKSDESSNTETLKPAGERSIASASFPVLSLIKLATKKIDLGPEGPSNKNINQFEVLEENVVTSTSSEQSVNVLLPALEKEQPPAEIRQKVSEVKEAELKNHILRSINKSIDVLQKQKKSEEIVSVPTHAKNVYKPRPKTADPGKSSVEVKKSNGMPLPIGFREIKAEPIDFEELEDMDVDVDPLMIETRGISCKQLIGLPKLSQNMAEKHIESMSAGESFLQNNRARKSFPNKILPAQLNMMMMKPVMPHNIGISSTNSMVYIPNNDILNVTRELNTKSLNVTNNKPTPSISSVHQVANRPVVTVSNISTPTTINTPSTKPNSTITSTTANAINPQSVPIVTTSIPHIPASPPSDPQQHILSNYIGPELAAAVTNAIARTQLPKLHPKPQGPLQSVVEAPSPLEAGTVTKIFNDNAHKLTDFFRAIIEETVDDLASLGCKDAKIRSLEAKIERLTYQHQLEVSEIKHNSDLILCEMRNGFEIENARNVAEARKQAEIERNRAVQEAKRKQWCAVCGKEANFYCCWNTSYCDYPCQLEHWKRHQTICAQEVRSDGGGDQSNSCPKSNPKTLISKSRQNNPPIMPRTYGLIPLQRQAMVPTSLNNNPCVTLFQPRSISYTATTTTVHTNKPIIPQLKPN